MKTQQKGFIVPLLLIMVALLLAGGAYFYTQNKSENPLVTENVTLPQASSTTQTINQTTSTAQVADCADFGAFSQFMLNNIEKPDSQNTIQMNKYVTTSFRWKRSPGEPFVSYPIINGIEALYENQQTLITAIKNDSNSLDRNLSTEATNLGLTADALNTAPFQSTAGGAGGLSYSSEAFGFKKGNSLYSVVLNAEVSHQAPGQGTVTVTCGRALDTYDRVYSALRLKADTTGKYPFSSDYVAIADISQDKNVYALLGSPNQIKTADYYYFDGNIIKLVSGGSYPANCAVLEAQKVGMGMRCADMTGTQRTVTYAGTQSMSGLIRSNFLIVSGQTPVTRAPGSWVYFWISIGNGLQNGNKEGCSIDFGDGHISPIFQGAECSSNSLPGLLHIYSSPDTYTAKIIGTWHDVNTNELKTEVLATTTVITTN